MHDDQSIINFIFFTRVNVYISPVGISILVQNSSTRSFKERLSFSVVFVSRNNIRQATVRVKITRDFQTKSYLSTTNYKVMVKAARLQFNGGNQLLFTGS